MAKATPKKTSPHTQLKADPHYQANFVKLQELIAEFIIDEPSNILPQLELETDLGVDTEVTFPKLITKINEEFDITLSAKELIEEAEDDEAPLTIENLALKVNDETQWG
jgi:hypothetical protein